jgi:hypothetical protein
MRDVVAVEAELRSGDFDQRLAPLQGFADCGPELAPAAKELGVAQVARAHPDDRRRSYALRRTGWSLCFAANSSAAVMSSASR